MARRLQRSALIPVSVQRAHDVVANVERYPEFLPGCHAVQVVERNADDSELVCVVEVEGRGLRERFTTANRHEPDRIVMSLRDGPFHELEGQWLFAAIGDAGCRITLQLTFEPKGMLAMMLTPMADFVADLLVNAFTVRMQSQDARTQGAQDAPTAP